MGGVPNIASRTSLDFRLRLSETEISLEQLDRLWYSTDELTVDLQHLLEVNRQDYADLFSTVQHDVACGGVPATSIRLNFIRHDAGGAVPLGRVVDTLVSYITHFCFAAVKRSGLSEQARNRAFVEAQRLFRKDPSSGQVGELLVYFLIESVLGAPQVLKKMPITTNPNDERKGSDGVHVRWSTDGQRLEVIFAESKLHKSFTSALSGAFKSMDDFHNSATKRTEVNHFLNDYRLLDSTQREVLLSYIEGEKKGNCQEVHVCLIGYDWAEYGCLKTKKKEKFLKEFEARYINWAKGEMKPLLDKELGSFKHTHLRFEFFLLPFTSVENFRALFLASLPQ